METKVLPIPVTRLLVITAADVEYNAVVSQLSGREDHEDSRFRLSRGKVGRTHVTAARASIGGIEFRELFQELLRADEYSCVLLIGLAGGLQPELRTGTAVFYDTCFQLRENSETSDTGGVYCDFKFSQKLHDLLEKSGVEAVFGAGLTMDFMVTRASEKLEMGQSCGAAAVDMESYDIIRVAGDFGVPTVVLRVILDEAGQTTPDFNRAINADGSINTLRSLLAMLIRPKATISFLLSLLKSVAILRKVARLVIQSAPDTRGNVSSLAVLGRQRY